MVENITSVFRGNSDPPEPTGTVHVFDPSPLNWLWINYHVVEELVRVSPKGLIEPAAMESHDWVDPQTLEITVREGEQFPGGAPLTVDTVKRSFDEMMRWKAPHPPGTQFNILPGSTCEVLDEHRVRFRFPESDGLALGKLRAMHILDDRFWNEVGYGYARFGTGEGHW